MDPNGDKGVLSSLAEVPLLMDAAAAAAAVMFCRALMIPMSRNTVTLLCSTSFKPN